jgi:hypothetical protein
LRTIKKNLNMAEEAKMAFKFFNVFEYIFGLIQQTCEKTLKLMRQHKSFFKIHKQIPCHSSQFLF